MLYEPAQFEALIDEPWDPARIEDAIAAIVADADEAFDPAALWPAHEWDGWEEPLPMKNLYVGLAADMSFLHSPPACRKSSDCMTPGHGRQARG